ncbi:MAG TPA: glycosyltransferase family 2 protein [Thermoplasmata archaeon]|nr:glycosyltransferase family 2 protein [Thermoplasmata archaeon]
MLSVTWTVLLVVYALLVLLVQGAPLYLAAQMPHPRGPRAPAPRPPAPLVSVIVAARNEEDDLGACLDGLLSQTYPSLEFLVVDGGSTDRTRDVARARSPRVSLLEEPPLPDGWVGKNWACWTGAQSARGEYLLFTDADVRPSSEAVWTAVEWAERERADLVTFASRIEMVSAWEKIVLPFYIQMVLTYFRTPRVNRPDSKTAMANGQFLLVRRGAYEETGGHRAIHDRILEDVALAQRFRAAGKVLRVGWTPELLTTRMYRTSREMYEGLLKTVSGVRFSAARQGAFALALVAFYWLPLALLPVGLWSGTVLVTAFGAFLWVALFGKHVAFNRAARGSGAYGLLFPVAVGYYLVLVLVALGRGLRGRPVEWKGRSYQLVDRRRHEPAKV